MNKMTLTFSAHVENEVFARTSAIAFLMPIQPDVEEIMEIKTILAEAIVNAMIHGYEDYPCGMITLEMAYDAHKLVMMIISDEGKGIENIALAMQPLYTTKQHLERSGMGMTIMSSFADSFDIISKKGEGTKIIIQKQLGSLKHGTLNK